MPFSSANKARWGSEVNTLSPTSSVSSCEIYGGLETMMSNFPVTACKTSDSRKWTETWLFLAFSWATAKASSEISTATTSQSGLAFAREIAMAPLPVPMSKIRKSAPIFSCKIKSTNSSVSGLGIKTRSSTTNSKPWKSALLIMYWAGRCWESCWKIASISSLSVGVTSWRSRRRNSVKFNPFKPRKVKDRDSASSPIATNCSSYAANNWA